jgi:RNA polymerase sigma factor (sigma-70 family)
MIADPTASITYSVPNATSAHRRSGTDQQRCSEAVDRLLGRFGWRLLAPDEFVRRTYAQLHSAGANDPHRAAMCTYSQALHAACSGVEGSARQNLAYTELLRYLHGKAARYYPDLCDDLAQSALTRTFTAFARCRQPETFFAFALQQLMDAARPLRRSGGIHVQSLDAPIGEGAGTLGEELPDRETDDPAEQAIAREQHVRLRQMADEFRRNHPRARDQLAVLWLKYVEGLNDSEISRRLGKPIKNIYVLRSRAITKLEKESSCQALAMELGILA